jgi:hypothetical protein
LSRKYDEFYSFAAACAPARRDCTSNRIDFGKKIYGACFAADEGMAQLVQTRMLAKKSHVMEK